MPRAVALVIAGVFVSACGAEPPNPAAPLVVEIFQNGARQSPNANGGNFGTPISPGEEVMPAGVVNTSQREGQRHLPPE